MFYWLELTGYCLTYRGIEMEQILLGGLPTQNLPFFSVENGKNVFCLESQHSFSEEGVKCPQKCKELLGLVCKAHEEC